MNQDRLSILHQYLKDDPSDEFTRFALAMEYRKLGRVDEAIREFEHLMSESPEYVGTYYHLGGLYAQSGDQIAAQRVYEKGVQIAERLRDHHAKSELKAALLDLNGQDLYE
jgi:tetratricopeptide (TPR) repeat protein